LSVLPEDALSNLSLGNVNSILPSTALSGTDSVLSQSALRGEKKGVVTKETDGITEDFAKYASNVSFTDSSSINGWFKDNTGMEDFITWFNDQKIVIDYNDLKPGRSPKQIAQNATGGFQNVWDNIPWMFGEGVNSINLIQFICLVSIMIIESRKLNFSGSEEELVSYPGHLGLAGAFDAIDNIKSSYNTYLSNKTAYDLINNADFNRVHGNLHLGDKLANTSDKGTWKGNRYPQNEYSTSTNPKDTGYIQQADFYKFRGRGLIQTTFRENYIPIIQYVRSYGGSNATIQEYQNSWKNMSDNDVVATITSTDDWYALFANTGYEIPCVAVQLHKVCKALNNLARHAQQLDAIGPSPGSIRSIAASVNPNNKSYITTFRSGVIEMLNQLDTDTKQ
jgi:hypothetical protein